MVRDQRKSDDSVVEGWLKNCLEDTEVLDSLALPELRAGSWRVDVPPVNGIHGFPLVDRTWIRSFRGI
jgi:hypothetical protein